MTRYLRFLHEGSPRYGALDGAEVSVIDPHPFARHRPTGERVPLEGIRLLAPVIPSKVIGVEVNRASRAHELQVAIPTRPRFYLKPSSSVIGPGEPIRVPIERSQRVEHEAQLAVVVGALLQRVTPQEAMTGVLGYTIANDVTARDLAENEGPWAKGFDSFCPLGPAIATGLDPHTAGVRCWVDGELRQEAVGSDLLFDVGTLLSGISQVMTLLPSDVVLTGTPAGAGPLHAGQRVRIEVDGIGSLDNLVVDRSNPGAQPNGQA